MSNIDLHPARGINIRRARLSDVAALLHIWELPTESEDAVAAIVEHGQTETAVTVHYVIELNEEVAAVFALTETWRPRPPRRVQLHNTGMAKRLRNTGIIDAMYSWLLRAEQFPPGTELIVLADRVRPDSYATFSHLGFRETHHGMTWSAHGSASVPDIPIP